MQIGNEHLISKNTLRYCKECNHFKNNYCFLKCKNVGADWLFCNRFKEVKNEQYLNDRM